MTLTLSIINTYYGPPNKVIFPNLEQSIRNLKNSRTKQYSQNIIQLISNDSTWNILLLHKLV